MIEGFDFRVEASGEKQKRRDDCDQMNCSSFVYTRIVMTVTASTPTFPS